MSDYGVIPVKRILDKIAELEASENEYDAIEVLKSLLD